MIHFEIHGEHLHKTPWVWVNLSVFTQIKQCTPVSALLSLGQIVSIHPNQTDCIHIDGMQYASSNAIFDVFTREKCSRVSAMRALFLINTSKMAFDDVYCNPSVVSAITQKGLWPMLPRSPLQMCLIQIVFLTKIPFAKWKFPFPLKHEIPGLNLYLTVELSKTHYISYSRAKFIGAAEHKVWLIASNFDQSEQGYCRKRCSSCEILEEMSNDQILAVMAVLMNTWYKSWLVYVLYATS